MIQKLLIINSCMACHFMRDKATDRFGFVFYCDALPNKPLLPRKEDHDVHKPLVVQSPTGEIPEWCPLEDK